MKKILALLLVAGVAPSLMGQGRILVDDFVTPDTAEGLGLLGSDFTAELWFAPGLGASAGSLQLAPGSQRQYLGTTGGDGSAGEGLFGDLGGLAYTFASTSGNITGQIRVWRNAGTGSGTSFESSLWQGVGQVFERALATGGSPNPTIPSEAINVTIVPEPSTFALAGLGAAALLIFRRRA